jgi:hypothetical protein
MSPSSTGRPHFRSRRLVRLPAHLVREEIELLAQPDAVAGQVHQHQILWPRLRRHGLKGRADACPGGAPVEKRHGVDDAEQPPAPLLEEAGCSLGVGLAKPRLNAGSS